MKILIAYDGSECSDAAILDLRRAGLPEVAEAVVLSVAEMPVSLMSESYVGATAALGMCLPSAAEDESSRHPLLDAQELAAQAADRLAADFPHWHIATESWVDAAAPAIVRKAHAWTPDLIVVGSHGRTGFAGLVLGSVSQHVLHHVNCSVRIGRHHLHSQERPIRLLLGADGSPDAAAALTAITSRPWPNGTEARIVAVSDRTLEYVCPVAATPESLPIVLEEQWRSRMSRLIGNGVKQLKMHGLHATGEVLTGKPASALVAEAEKWAADCIFLGARGLNAAERLFLGSVSTAVSAHARRSVEVVKSPVA